ncbi:hypothetical protein BC937DRAFT_89855 [Endogone sp. FLAS-F59071]|nr:hypothetical protein BC937DRAFT_89855 [Endogone sp. FLAS-F59071]|eukprot:RUS22280.1 hypothetical protein BC937DRAFT_89855 [Endogone sp. FLAS-F59071]
MKRESVRSESLTTHRAWEACPSQISRLSLPYPQLFPLVSPRSSFLRSPPLLPSPLPPSPPSSLPSSSPSSVVSSSATPWSPDRPPSDVPLCPPTSVWDQCRTSALPARAVGQLASLRCHRKAAQADRALRPCDIDPHP